jgi:hypothetical protein
VTEKSNDCKWYRLQVVSLTEQMQNLITSLKTLTLPDVIRQVEENYARMGQERERLEKEIASLDIKQHRQISIEQARALFARVINDWDKMTQDERRNVLGLFIERIEASEYSRSGAMKLMVFWKDRTSEEITLWHKPKAKHWTRENVNIVAKYTLRRSI